MIRFTIKLGLLERGADFAGGWSPLGPVGSSYAGGPGHVNNPADCALGGPEHGPLPPGLYRIGAPVDNAHGPGSLPLTPLLGNQMQGRCPLCGNFLIHADNHSKPPQESSEGCVVAPPDQRAAIAHDPDSLLLVVAE